MTLYRPAGAQIQRIAPGVWLINSHVVEQVCEQGTSPRWNVIASSGETIDSCRSVNDAVHSIQMNTPEFRAVVANVRSSKHE